MIPFLLTGLLATAQEPLPMSLRLALTPKIDGVIDSEEWDPFVSPEPFRGFLQWEPGALYVAGEVPSGQEARVSFDLKSDGWIIGEDNLEVTVSQDGVKVRRLIQDIQAGARWQDEPLIAQTILCKTESNESGYAFEFRWLGLGATSFERGKKFNVRMEAREINGPEVMAFVPRATAPIELALDRATGLPEGMSWAPEHAVRSVVPGEQIKLRLNFVNKGESGVGRIDLRTLGFASLFTSSHQLPFPSFDKKKRAFVDYQAVIAEGAPYGYTRLVAKLDKPDGSVAVIESSYQITDILTVVPNLRVEKGEVGTPRLIRGDVKLISNTNESLKGKMYFDLPDGWALRKGNDAGFGIYRERGQTKMGVELVSPQGLSGLHSIPIRIQIGEKTIITTEYLVLD
ncbi:MAG: hypothetical protein JNK63_07565 [Chthonomonas sp.]|nr:hypothetical protein [Chthonomonas sp.]